MSAAPGAASGPRAARIARELKNLSVKPPWGISCVPAADSSEQLEATMLGPRSSPYAAGTFRLSLVLPERYPFEPPQVTFLTPVYHPNVDKGGRICMDMLKMPPKGAWLPTITLETLLVSLQTLLACPNPDDPLMADIAREFKHDPDAFDANARSYTEKYAAPAL